MKQPVVGRAGSAALVIGVVLAPVTIAAADTSQGMVSASRAAAGVSSPPPLTAIGAEGSDGQLWAQAPQLGSGWSPLGGRIVAPPAVAAPASASGSMPADPLFIATGTDGTLWIRSAVAGWQPVGAAQCIGGPGAVITGSTLTVACRGTDNALWYTTTTVPASGLPVFTGSWTSLGGVLSAGPAVAPVGSTVTFFVRGTSGAIYTRTATAGYTQTSWGCIGAPAAAQPPGSGVTTFACQGTDRGSWEATSSGTGWAPAVSLGGTLVGGPAVVAGSQETDLYAEGTDHAVWQRTPAGWTSLGGGVVGGVGAVALNLQAGTPWGNAIEVPGTAALNTGSSSGVGVQSVSCPSAGNCTVGGQYVDSSGHYQVFVADEVNGTWGNATEVPGTAALNTGGSAGVSSVSCSSAGNCTAGGEYADGSGNGQAFVADEVNGTWEDALQVPGTAALNTGGNAGVGSVSCGSAGNCVAGGFYWPSNGSYEAFVADEVSGTWKNAIEVPGTAALNTGNHALVLSLSCPSAGNCVAGGTYWDSSGLQAFVADEMNGTWEDATEVPGTAALNTGGSAAVTSVSCPSARDCAAGGNYRDSSGGSQVFVADEVNGTWDDAIGVPGTAGLNAGGGGEVTSLSCPSAGNCAVVGSLATSPGISEGFVADEVSGTWGDAIWVPGASTYVASVSCPSAGNCVAGGYHEVSPGSVQMFVVSEVNGTWGEAIQVPGLNTDNGYVESVSCPPAGGCAAGGTYYPAGSSGGQAFVVSQS